MKNYKLLIIDDEYVICKRMEMFFTRRDYQVVCANNSDSGYNSFLEFEPDIIILDISIDGKGSGFVLADKFQAYKNSRIIFITGFVDLEIRRKAQQYNPLGFFTKPVNMKEVFSAIENLT